MATVSSRNRGLLGTALELPQVDSRVLNPACHALGTGWVKILHLVFPSLSYRVAVLGKGQGWGSVCTQAESRVVCGPCHSMGLG